MPAQQYQFPPTAALTVTLEAQQWNQVMAVLFDTPHLPLPHRAIAALFEAITAQFQAQAPQNGIEHPSNGLDRDLAHTTPN